MACGFNAFECKENRCQLEVFPHTVKPSLRRTTEFLVVKQKVIFKVLLIKRETNRIIFAPQITLAKKFVLLLFSISVNFHLISTYALFGSTVNSRFRKLIGQKSIKKLIKGNQMIKIHTVKNDHRRHNFECRCPNPSLKHKFNGGE